VHRVVPNGLAGATTNDDQRSHALVLLLLQIRGTGRPATYRVNSHTDLRVTHRHTQGCPKLTQACGSAVGCAPPLLNSTDRHALEIPEYDGLFFPPKPLVAYAGH